MPRGPFWTKKEIKMLGTMPDDEVARRIKRAPRSVSQYRRTLGIPRYARHVWWNDKTDALLGVISDGALAEMAGCSKKSVLNRRRKLGIAAFVYVR